MCAIAENNTYNNIHYDNFPIAMGEGKLRSDNVAQNYIMIQINLKDNCIVFYPAGLTQTIKFNLDNDLVDQKPFRIVVSLGNSHKNGVGLGLVRLERYIKINSNKQLYIDPRMIDIDVFN